jgi:hypothetical protein
MLRSKSNTSTGLMKSSFQRGYQYNLPTTYSWAGTLWASEDYRFTNKTPEKGLMQIELMQERQQLSRHALSRLIVERSEGSRKKFEGNELSHMLTALTAW